MIVAEVMLAVILCALVTKLVIFAFKWCRVMKIALKAQGPSPWFMVRNCMRFTYNTLSVLNELGRKYGHKPFCVLAPRVITFVVADPDDVAVVMKSPHLSEKPTLISQALDGYFTKNILSGNGEFWNRCRRSVGTAFHKQALESYLPQFNSGSQNLVKVLQQQSQNEKFKMQDVSLHVVPEVTLELAFQKKLEPENLHLLKKTVKRGMYFVHVKSVNPIFFFFERIRSVYRAFVEDSSKLVFECCQDIIKRKEDFKDFLLATEKQADPRFVTEHMLTKHKGSVENLPLSNDELAGQVMLVGISGMETSTNALTLVLAMLALHPEVQSKAREEILAIFGESDRSATMDDLKQMDVLDRVIKESIRLYPPVPVFARKALDDVDVNGTVVPKGAVVVVNLSSLHRNPRTFKNPNKFDPDRFLPENACEIPSFGYIPFSRGARSCIAGQFSMNQVKVLVSRVLRNFEIRSSPGFTFDDVQIEAYMTARLVKPVMLRVEPLVRKV